MTTVLKLGGELLDDPAAIHDVANRIVRIQSRGKLAVVHGGGRAIDSELRKRSALSALLTTLRGIGAKPRWIRGEP